MFRANPEYDIDPFKTIERWESLDKSGIHSIRVVIAKTLCCDDLEKLKDSDDIKRRIAEESGEDGYNNIVSEPSPDSENKVLEKLSEIYNLVFVTCMIIICVAIYLGIK